MFTEQDSDVGIKNVWRFNVVDKMIRFKFKIFNWSSNEIDLVVKYMVSQVKLTQN